MSMSSDETQQPKSKPRVPPPKRVYEEREHDREIDSSKRVRTLQMASWSLAGGVVGALAGLGIGYKGGFNLAIAVVLGFVLGFLFTFLTAHLLTEGAGSVAGTIYHPSGKSAPPKREYSYPESLAARGHYEDAVTAYQLCCADYPDDPEPYVRIGRIYRDELENYQEALFWFKRARSEATVGKGRELLITQEIIEIYTRKLDTPRKAIPELARLVDRFPDDPAAARAKEEIRRLRETM
ncbi:MAG: hypothetical protein ACE5HT_02975 [Gemmatimonadales bacterium]